MIRLLFYLFAVIILGSAIFVAASKNLVRSIFMFFVTLLALSGMCVLALADFVAITQMVIYVGGILVLIIFAFMLSGRESLTSLQNKQSKIFNFSNSPALFIAGLFFVVMVNMLLKMDTAHLPWIIKSVADGSDIKPNSNMTPNIGVNLVTQYLLPFEAISILLLMALVGAAHLSRKEGQS
jgi:NADH-quinone oxidoreductase subunit J